MKIPEFELKWSHVIFGAIQIVIIVLCLLLFVEFRVNKFRGQINVNTGTINAMVQQLVQKGILEVQAQQQPAATPVEQPVPEKK
jgi:DNA-binding HxlR family transcriptional regulator